MARNKSEQVVIFRYVELGSSITGLQFGNEAPLVSLRIHYRGNVHILPGQVFVAKEFYEI